MTLDEFKKLYPEVNEEEFSLPEDFDKRVIPNNDYGLILGKGV